MSDYRLSYKPSLFTSQLKVLDDLQQSTGTPPNAHKYLDWHWTSTESDHVTEVRTKAEEYWHQMENKKNCPPLIKDLMKVLINDFMNYDHGESDAHHLLNKIADFGSLTDCDIVGVKRGTPLAKKPSQGTGNELAGKIRPSIVLRDNDLLVHMLAFMNSQAPKSKAMPEGMKRIKVYRYIGKDAPAKINQYEFLDNANRGLLKSHFDDVEPSNEKLYAWYIARYEDTRGKLYDVSERLKVEILFPAS